MTIDSHEMRHVDEAPEQRRGMVRTRSGLVIGRSYVPPPRPLTADAERIQSALLDPSCRKPLSLKQYLWRRIARWL